MEQDANSNNGQDGPFGELLFKAVDDAKNGRKPNEEFFENGLYGREVTKISRVHKLKHEDAHDVRQVIDLKVMNGLPFFNPNYDLEYGGVFTWIRQIARNRVIDVLRASRTRIESVDDHVDNLKDERVDLDKQIRQRELLEEFNRCLDEMPTKERLALMCIKVLELPSRVAAVILTAAGFPCTHTTALKWASDALRRYFQEPLERKESARAGTRGKQTPPKKQAAQS